MGRRPAPFPAGRRGSVITSPWPRAAAARAHASVLGPRGCMPTAPRPLSPSCVLISLRWSASPRPPWRDVPDRGRLVRGGAGDTGVSCGEHRVPPRAQSPPAFSGSRDWPARDNVAGVAERRRAAALALASNDNAEPASQQRPERQAQEEFFARREKTSKTKEQEPACQHSAFKRCDAAGAGAACAAVAIRPAALMAEVA